MTLVKQSSFIQEIFTQYLVRASTRCEKGHKDEEDTSALQLTAWYRRYDKDISKYNEIMTQPG